MHLRDVAPVAEFECGQHRRLRLHIGLAEEEGEPGAEDHQADADGDVIDTIQAAEEAVQHTEQDAGETGTKHADPRRAALVGHRVTGHCTHDQRPFEAEVDAPRLLGKALAEADEKKRRADANRAADQRDYDGPVTEVVTTHVFATLG